MIRPSALSLAELCPESAYLSQEFPSGSDLTRFGNAVDLEISTALTGGAEPAMPEAVAAVAWARAKFGTARMLVQKKVTLTNPETGEIITEGTPDLLVLPDDKKVLFDVDWKKRGQMWAGYIPPPDRNLQQLTYAAAAAMEYGYESFQVIIAPFDSNGVHPIEGSVFTSDQWWGIFDRVAAIQTRKREAVLGDHCDACYSKKHCHGYMLPAHTGPSELAPFAQPIGLTPSNIVEVLRIVQRYKKASAEAIKIAEGQLRGFVNEHGPIRDGDEQWGPIPTNGSRKGATVEELEKAGLVDLIKPGTPGVRWDWSKAKEPVAEVAEKPKKKIKVVGADGAVGVDALIK